MGIESATTIAELNAAWPLGTDMKSEGDNHLRLIKDVMQKDAVSKAGDNIVTGITTFQNGGGSVRLKNDTLAANIGTWSVDVTAGGTLQITPRDGSGAVLSGGGGFQITRYASGALDYLCQGANVANAAPTAQSVVTRARGDQRYTLASSSTRYKEDQHAGTPEAEVEDLDPKYWVWGGELEEDDPRRGKVGFGLIAEEVLAVFPAAVVKTPEGVVEGLNPLALIGLLVCELQAVKARLNELEGL